MHTFQEIVAKLNAFWAKKGCLIYNPYDLEKGAGTFNPATFLRCLGKEPFNAAYIEPCRRPKDGRYGKNPNRLQHYFQYQVILKPSPYNIQDLYLESLTAIGFDLNRHDIRFVHDDWESPTLGAWGLGWEVWVDGMECTQFTYFQAVAGIPLHPITGEITYGIERLVMYLQNVDSVYDIKWNDSITYGDLFLKNEEEWSKYNFELSDPKMWFRHFEDYEREAKRLVSLKLPIPAYDFVIKASHAFNMLDARGVISVTERASYIAQIRDIARHVAECYLESRKEQGFPLTQKFAAQLPLMPPQPAPAEPKVQNKKDEPQDFLLEIGSEELPASFVPIGLRSLEHLVRHLLQEKELVYKSIKTMGTPRRLAVLVEGLSPGKKAHTLEKRGPSVENAFDSHGKPTQGAMGFFRSLGKQNYTREEIEKGKIPEISIKEVKDAKYLFGMITIPPVETVELLQKALPGIILAIDFPKQMRWADLDISFARPIRWIAALFGQEIIPFSIGPILASNISYGHRQLSPQPFTISSTSDYRPLLKSKNVLVDCDERKAFIEKELQEYEKANNCTIVSKERVIPQVLHLVEWPYLTSTEFDKEFLKVPKEVLVSEMVEHQKYFPVSEKDGTLKNNFIVCANMVPTDSIRKGNRKVLSARLADGVFLYEQDLKTPMEVFQEKLKGIVFQKGLGTLHDKVERLTSDVQVIAPYFPKVDMAYLEETAKLCKADLTSEMVGEFPELQGEMGRIYATHHKMPIDVALAIDEHWMPRRENAPLPTSVYGTILSLADKLDNLLGFFALELKPTSSSDPYALRRQGLGIIRMLIQNQVSFPLLQVLEGCLKSFPKEIRDKKAILLPEIHNFLIARAKTVLMDLGFSRGEIDACLTVRSDDFYDIFKRLQALKSFRQENLSFQQLIEVHKRCQGQINGISKKLSLKEALLLEKEEKNLFSAIQSKQKQFSQAVSSREYTQAFHLLSELQLPLAELFDNVKILADDEKLKNNRLALLQEVAGLFAQLADFQKIMT